MSEDDNAPSAAANATTSRGNKIPPRLQKAKLKVWRLVTCLPKDEQGGAILASLEGAEGEAEDAVLELSVEELTADNSVDLIIN